MATRLKHPDNAWASSHAGLTLFEVLLATAMVGTVFLGFLASSGASFLAVRGSNDCTQSQTLGVRVLEEVLDNDFDDLLSLDGMVVTQGDFRVEISVVHATRDLRLVEVVVTNPDSHLGAIHLLTYRGKR